ncbi:MAG: D-alanyl-D-alanine carboxypeptidase [Clostridiales bacterium]|jgi:D-alanyl-D-alanine carboxypeptidase (penicillin-binding protein 5/6)|nr:D-alanyl-D-alanine carboxypeptidase [Clostridiales bacterium]
MNHLQSTYIYKTMKMTFILIALIFLLSALPAAHVYATQDQTIEIIVEKPNTQDEFELTAEGAVLMEQRTGKVLFGKQAHTRLYPASTTKILTALLAAEHGDLDEIVTVGEEICMLAWDGSKAGLEENEKISLRDLVYGLLINSGNDAANTIAVHIARKVSGKNLTTEEALNYFNDMMNQRAKEAGAYNTHFANPHGYHDESHYTTPYDLAMIGREAMKNEFFREAIGVRAMDNKYWSTGEPRFWRSKNKLINEKSSQYYEYAVGGKTGYTRQAGQCLISFAAKNGMDLITVVMKSAQDMQWPETRMLFEFGFNNFEYYAPIEMGTMIERVPVDNHLPDEPGFVSAVITENWQDILRKDDIKQIKQEIRWEPSLLSENAEEETPRLKAPIYEGQKIGELYLTLKGKELARIPLAASQSIKGKKQKKVMENITPDEPEPKEGSSSFSWFRAILVLLSAFLILRTTVFFINYSRRRKRKRRYENLTIYRRF